MTFLTHAGLERGCRVASGRGTAGDVRGVQLMGSLLSFGLKNGFWGKNVFPKFEY